LIHCFDFGHHHVFGKIPFQEWLFYLNPQRHLHFHIHDNKGDRDTHLPPGRGSIDWFKVKKALSRLEVDYSIALEPHTREDLLESLAFYRRFFLEQS